MKFLRSQATFYNFGFFTLRESGVPVVGELLHSVGTHAAIATGILERAA